MAAASAAKLSCESTVMPVTAYGNGTSNGYVYTPDAGVTTFMTSALDVTEQGGTPMAWLPVVKSSCVGGSSTATQLRVPGREREALRRFQPASAAH